MPAAHLVGAYRATRYQVTTEEGVLEVRVGTRSSPIEALLKARGATVGTFLTAANPRSQPRPAPANARANARLEARLKALGHAPLPHRGVGDDPAWPPEEGFFVPGLDAFAGLRLAEAFGQFAVLVVRVGQPATLRWSRLAPAGDAQRRPTAPMPSAGASAKRL